MNKIFSKWLSLCVLFAITACSTNHTANSDKRGAKYKISDNEVKTWIVERNKAQQCLFPKGTATVSVSQPFLYQMATYNRPLQQVIGDDNYLTVSSDAASQQYLAAKLRKFNHNKKATFAKAWCNDLRKEYGMLVKLAQIQPTQAKATNKAEKKSVKKAEAGKKQKASTKSRKKTTTLKSAKPQVTEESIWNDEIQSQEPSGTYDGDEQIRINSEPFKNETIHF